MEKLALKRFSTTMNLEGSMCPSIGQHTFVCPNIGNSLLYKDVCLARKRNKQESCQYSKFGSTYRRVTVDGKSLGLKHRICLPTWGSQLLNIAVTLVASIFLIAQNENCVVSQKKAQRPLCNTMIFPGVDSPLFSTIVLSNKLLFWDFATTILACPMSLKT